MLRKKIKNDKKKGDYNTVVFAHRWFSCLETVHHCKTTDADVTIRMLIDAIVRETASDLTLLNGKCRSNGLEFFSFFFLFFLYNEQPAARLADPVCVMKLDLGFDATPMTGFHDVSTGSCHLPTPSAHHPSYTPLRMTEIDPHASDSKGAY